MQRSRPVLRRGVGDRTRKSAATDRIQDRAVPGTAPPTSSLFLCPRERFFQRVTFHLLFEPSLRTRGQAEDADKTLGVLLVVTVAHGERSDIQSVQRVRRHAR